MKFAIVKKSLNDQFVAKLTELHNKAREHYGIPFKMPELYWKQIGRAAGRAYLTKGYIVLNPDYCKNHLDDMLNDTLPHELAHMYVAQKCGLRADRGHGPHWKSMMRNCFGLNPKRTHSFSLEGVKTRGGMTYTYRCGCRIHELSRTKHNRMLRDSKSYRCKLCKQHLTWTLTGHNKKETSVASFKLPVGAM